MAKNKLDMSEQFTAIIRAVRRISSDAAEEVEAILREGRENPLPRQEAARLLTRVIETLKKSAAVRRDRSATKTLRAEVEVIVNKILETRNSLTHETHQGRRARTVHLTAHNGIPTGKVEPRPCFHGREVPMNCGFVKTTDIQLWDANERLDIHLNQFRQSHGKEPTADQLLEIMMGKLPLPGVDKEDEFEIVKLARSIAINGVQKPPIIDIDGALLDGNRRVTACRHILASSEFTTEQKRRAEYVFVWQLTEHATADEREAVVVALNFEEDCKKPWPDYVKARKVFADWQAMLSIEDPAPGQKRQAEMKRELSMKYALGPDTQTVNRYIKMVDWADEFESYHLQIKKRDEFEVKHRANEYFQYFDELGKGTKPGGVAYALGQDESFKHLVFDLLFDGKFRNWNQIRDLRHICDNTEARQHLIEAAAETNLDEAQQHVEDAIAIARSRRAEDRTLGANNRIESFVKFLEALPVKAFRDDIYPENLDRLYRALKLVESHVNGTSRRQAGKGKQ